ncbi:MAG: hypothetical protein VW235_11640 [Rhodospirillaceae bacterium]|jgi:hypothetical protein
MKNIDKEISLWKYAGRTLPFAALAAIIFSFWIDPSSLTNKVIITTCTVFFAVSVFWWWWALDKFSILIKEKLGIEEKFNILAEELKNIRNDLKR